VKIVASWFYANLCAYCASSSGNDGVVDKDLTPEWKSVLPICASCRSDGGLPLARTRRRNGARNERRTQRARLASSIAPQSHEENVVPVEATNGEVVPVEPVEPDARLTGRRKRRNPTVAKVTRTRKASSRCVASA
jgi:hypothetical protein